MTTPADRPLRTALIVDDDDELSTALTRALERRGFTVQCARTGTEALGMLGGIARLDAAIVDLVLPGVGGIEVVQRVRAAHATCRIVGTTGLGSPTMESAFLAAGADRFLLKPVKIPDLDATLDAAAP